MFGLRVSEGPRKGGDVYFLTWIICGSVTGWMTGSLVSEGGYGPVVNIAMGIAGAVAAGFLASSPEHGGLVYTSFAAVLGAATVTGVNAYASARKRYA
jgi:uncharacterized membrane protein YeaQ/YmgE (transglycosylase-associated protein family)